VSVCSSSFLINTHCKSILLLLLLSEVQASKKRKEIPYTHSTYTHSQNSEHSCTMQTRISPFHPNEAIQGTNTSTHRLYTGKRPFCYSLHECDVYIEEEGRHTFRFPFPLPLYTQRQGRNCSIIFFSPAFFTRLFI